MSYPASGTIAAEHPELADLVNALDRLLYELGPVPIRLASTAEILGIEPATLKRLLRQYEAHGIVEGIEIALCPTDGATLEPAPEGWLWCDLCETEYRRDQCEAEVTFRLRPGLAPVPPPPEPAVPGELEGHPPLAAIRELLLEAFTAEEFRRLFLYTSRPELKQLLDEFSPSDGLAAMVDRAILYCHKHDLLPDLLREVKQANPRQYARYESQFGELA
jgi:DNA-binding Lrp family transcriptional regulator